MKNHLVVSLAYDGLCMFEFGCTVEVFGIPRPELEVEWYDFAVCGIEPGMLRSTAGVGVHAPHGLDVAARADTIIVSGWRGVDSEVPAELVRVLREAHGRGARLVSICSGAFVLGAAGLLDGRRATTHWRYAGALAARFPRAIVEPDALYVDEGRIVTSAGSAAGLDMMLHLVRRDHGARVCNTVARRLVIPPHREGGQAQFVSRPVPATENSRLHRVIEHMRLHATSQHRMDEMAAMAAMSPRSFFRKFREAVGMSPYEWLVRERIAIAKELLEDGRLSIDRVSDAAGFGSTETFRHHFRRVVGRGPADYRRSFSVGLQDAA
jgi:AraC family transcriptional regulator, transcriptional activator FtrA